MENKIYITADHLKVLRILYCNRHKKRFQNLETFLDKPHQTNQHYQTIISKLYSNRLIEIKEGTGHPPVVISGGKNQRQKVHGTYNHPYQPLHVRITPHGIAYYKEHLKCKVKPGWITVGIGIIIATFGILNFLRGC